MLHNEYKREMERLGPGQEELNRLYTMIEGRAPVRRTKRLGRRAAAVILACAALAATAAAASPTVWEVLQARLGPFAPYAQTIEGAVCTDQGIELQVLSALADDVQGWIYLSVRDVEGDRLNERLRLYGSLKVEIPEGIGSNISNLGGGNLKLLSYDTDTKTALLAGQYSVGDPEQPVRYTTKHMTTQVCDMNSQVSITGMSPKTLESLPVSASDRIVFRPSDVGNSEYDDTILPAELVVLAPNQNPMPIEGTEDMWVSSMGFASDGCLHIRLEYAEGVEDAFTLNTGGFFCRLDTVDEADMALEKYFRVLETRVEGGLDILFPLVHADEADRLKYANFYGQYQVPGSDIQGEWTLSFQPDYQKSTILEWIGELAGRQITHVTVSPLTVTMDGNDSGGFNAVGLCAMLRDGSTVNASPVPGGSLYVGNGSGSGSYSSHNVWSFEEPVNVEDIVSLTLLDETIPVN